VREHSLAKVPVIFAVGKREAEEKTVTIRRFGSQAQETKSLAEALAALEAEAVPPDQRR
jgi:threonyl-tRNA synthetase